MRRPFRNRQRQVLAEPRRPTLPQIQSPDDVPPETSEETTTGPSVGEDDFSLLRSRYWHRIHYCKLLCKRTCSYSVARTKGLSITELQELGGKIGAKLDNIGLPGMSAELSSKQSSSRTQSKEQSETTTFDTQPGDCTGLAHARYRLMEKFTFEYTEPGFFGKRKRKVYPVERELEVFDETSIEFVVPGCCKERDLDLAEQQKNGYVVLVVARDGPLAAILPAKPTGGGGYKLPGARGSFRAGDRVPPNIVTRWLNSGADARASWSNAAPILERYQGSSNELEFAELAHSKKEGGAGLGRLLLSLCVGGAMGLLWAGLRSKKKRDERRLQRAVTAGDSAQTPEAPTRGVETREPPAKSEEDTAYSTE